MSLAHLATRPVVTAPAWVTADDLARRMDDENVGSLVITREGVPVGIVTDRDLVLRVLRPRRDPDRVRASEIMTSKLECISVDRQPLEALALMRARGIRRLPVLGEKSELIGIVTYDDLVAHVAATSLESAQAIARFPAAAPRA